VHAERVGLAQHVQAGDHRNASCHAGLAGSQHGGPAVKERNSTGPAYTANELAAVLCALRPSRPRAKRTGLEVLS
jgi:hypothetical protein